MSEQLTVKEALEQGYENYFIPSNGWQGVNNIADITPDVFLKEDIYLCNKEPQIPSSLSADIIAEMIAERAESDYEDETGSDDASNIYEGVLALNYFDIAQKIKEEMANHGYYKQSKIQLVP